MQERLFVPVLTTDESFYQSGIALLDEQEAILLLAELFLDPLQQKLCREAI